MSGSRRDFLVTGTDTGVGKTVASAGLLRAWRSRGHAVAGFKPVASGCKRTADGLRNDDGLALGRESSRDWPYEVINPYAFEPAIAPHLAAAEAGVEVVLGRIRRAFRRLQQGTEAVVVEGAGGFLVPLAPGLATPDLAAGLGLEVILVVGLRLGCLNHAFLSAEAILHRGLPFAGWVGNLVDPGFDRLEENLACLHDALPAPCIGVIAHLASPDPAAVAARLTGLPRLAG